MRARGFSLLLCCAFVAICATAFAEGEVTKYTFDNSKIFPGTTRDYWVYVPKQYDPATPAFGELSFAVWSQLRDEVMRARAAEGVQA